MSRPNGVFKKTNEYQESIDRAFYEECPKAVFAAMAVSYAANLQGVTFEEMTSHLKEEWKTLYINGIVPQKPSK